MKVFESRLACFLRKQLRLKRTVHYLRNHRRQRMEILFSRATISAIIDRLYLI